MARWYLVRHGETAWNAARRIQGQTDIPLHADGIAGAERLAARLAGVRFAAVYVSGLTRTEQTARIILEGQRLPAALDGLDDPPEQVQLPSLTVRPALQEIRYGVLEGLTWEQVRVRDPRLQDRSFARDMDFAPEGGESFRALLERTSTVAVELEERHRDEDVLIVAHGGSLRALAVGLLGLPPEAFWRLRGLEPASLSVITHDGALPALTAWNDTGHHA